MAFNSLVIKKDEGDCQPLDGGEKRTTADDYEQFHGQMRRSTYYGEKNSVKTV